VEFTIPAVLRWADVRPALESGFAIEGNRIVIRCRVDAVDEQHVVTLDVGGAVILAEFADGPSEDPVGATIELPDTRLEIYPTGI